MVLLTVRFSLCSRKLQSGTEVLVVAEGKTLVHIEAHDTEDPFDPEEPEEPEDFVGILIEVIDDLVVIDSKEQGRVIVFYIINDENGAPDREVLAMLKEIAIGTEVLVVAEGETTHSRLRLTTPRIPLIPKNLRNQKTLWVS